MQVHYTNDVNEARTCRRAQFSGAIAAVTVGNIIVTGIVHPVMEDASSEPKRWTVKIIHKKMPNGKPFIPQGNLGG